MSNHWWRSWHGAPTDPKWLLIAKMSGSLPGEVAATAWALFDYASQNADRGNVADFDVETFSVFSGFGEQKIRTIIRAMTERKIIENDRLSAWEERQPQREDNSSERVRKFRQSQKDKAVETQRNATKRSETPDKIRGDKIREEKKETLPTVVGQGDRFDEFWRIYPRQRRGSPDKGRRAYLKALKEKRANEQEIIDGAAAYAESDEVARGYAKGAAAWLNDDRWTVDYTGKPARHQHQNKSPSYSDQIRAAGQRALAELESELVGEGSPQATE